MEEERVALVSKNLTAVRECIDEKGGVESESGEATGAHLSHRIVHDGLPCWRDLGGEADACDRTFVAENGKTEIKCHGGFQCLPECDGTEIEFGGKRYNMGAARQCIIILWDYLGVTWNFDTLLCLSGAEIEFLFKRLHLLALNKAALEGTLEKFPSSPDIFANGLQLADDVGEEGEILIVVGGKMMNDDVARLAVAVQAAVALLKPGRIPRDVPVQKKPGRFLEIQPFRRRIGCDEKPNLGARIIESGLDVGSLMVAHVA